MAAFVGKEMVDGVGHEENRDEDIYNDILSDLTCLDIFDEGSTIRTKRPTCDRCMRPITVCWCPFLPHEPFDIKTSVYILQHPYEETRSLRTVPILQNCIPQEKCHVFRGKRFPKSRFPDLSSVFASPDTVLLYPGEDATDLSSLPTRPSYNLVLLDGTWPQAKGIYAQNPVLKTLRKVQINVNHKSKYVIRTQPKDSALSTLETTALAIAILEERPEISQALTEPLVALCNFQIQHGATEHQSREFKVENGLWTKRLPRSTQRRLAHLYGEHASTQYRPQ